MKPTTHATITRSAIQHCKGKISNDICKNTHNIVQGSIDEDESKWTIFSRIWNWHFYRSNDSISKRYKTFLTTSEEILKKRIETLSNTDINSEKFYKHLGRILHHIQDMSTPSHVLPIYHGPKFPIELKLGIIDDHFESFMEEHDCRISLDGISSEITIDNFESYSDFTSIYESSAQDMLQNILMINDTTPIEDRPYRKYWKHYTESKNPKIDGFGVYGDEKDFIDQKEEIIDSLFEIQDTITKHAIQNTCKAILLVNKILKG